MIDMWNNKIKEIEFMKIFKSFCDENCICVDYRTCRFEYFPDTNFVKNIIFENNHIPVSGLTEKLTKFIDSYYHKRNLDKKG